MSLITLYQQILATVGLFEQDIFLQMNCPVGINNMLRMESLVEMEQACSFDGLLYTEHNGTMRLSI